MIEIKQVGLTLQSEDKIIPAQYSDHIPISFVKEKGYENYAVIGAYAYRDGCRLISGVMEFKDGHFILPANPFMSSGRLDIGIKLVSADESPSLGTVEFYVRKGVNPNIALPEEPVWSNLVKNLVEQLIKNIYVDDIENLINQASSLQNAVNKAVESVNRKLANGDFMPNIQVGSTTTVAAGQPAKVELSGTKENPVLLFEIPKGADGTGAGDGNAITKNGGRQQVDESFLLESTQGYSLVGFNGGHSVFGNNYNSSLFYSRNRPTIYFEESNEIVVRSMAMMEDIENVVTKTNGIQRVPYDFNLSFSDDKNNLLLGLITGRVTLGNKLQGTDIHSVDRPWLYYKENDRDVAYQLATLGDVSKKQNIILSGSAQPSSNTGEDGDVYIMFEG